MALKALLTRKKIDAEKMRLEACRAKDADFSKREMELENAINELGDDATDEERAAVEGEVDALNEEKRANEEEKSKIQEAIDKLQEILDAEEADQPTDEPVGTEQNDHDNVPTGRKRGVNIMKRYADMSYAERKAFCEIENVRKFIADVRNIRAVNGTDIIIPEEVLPLLTDTVNRYSKLRSVVNLKQIGGKARVPVLGTIPEAVWTEQGGKINELALSFSQVDIDGYKVAGFIPVSNWILEDNDVDLLGNIVDAIGQAIGYALDKAIVFGSGEKMPEGIVKNLDEGNKVTIAAASTGSKFFKEFLIASGKAKANYAPNNRKIWLMNETTLTAVKAEALTFNASGAIVADVNSVMPVIGGEIITLDFIKDNIIIGGYASMYLLGERKGAAIAQSKEVKFIEDETVIKGTARYDGKVLRKEAFVAIGINGATFEADELKPQTDFTEDTANMG